MNWKSALGLIILFSFTTIIVYNGVMFFLSGQPLTVQEFLTYLFNRTQTTITIITTWVQDKLLVVLGAIGGAVSGITTVAKLASSRINQAKTVAATAENNLASVSLQARQEIEKLEGEKKDLKKQVDDLKDQDYPKLLEEAQTATTQARSEANTLRTQLQTAQQMGNVDYVRKLQAALQANNIPIPPYEGSVITVVK